MQSLVQLLDVEDDLSHLVDSVVAALGRRAVARHALYIHADFHAAALAAINAAICRLGGDYELRANLVFVNDVLPAQAITIFFLNGAGNQYGV